MNSYLYRILRKSKILPQKTFVKLHYNYQTGKTLDLENPKDFNEKIQWLKVYYKPSILTKLVDKYAVRSFVSERNQDQYLNDIYGVWESPEAIDFSKLPQSFVLKATHGYNMNYIVRDKNNLEETKVREIVANWLSVNHYYSAGMEWAYKDVKPRVIAEKILVEKGKDYITDYKFFCFNGKPRFLKVDIDRGNNHSKCYYDTQWNKLPFAKKGNSVVENDLEKPNNLDEMVALTEVLAQGFPFVRVDLYNLDGNIVFGEMTFYPGDGRTEFEPDEYNRIIGDYIELPTIKNDQKVITQYPTIIEAAPVA